MEHQEWNQLFFVHEADGRQGLPDGAVMSDIGAVHLFCSSIGFYQMVCLLC